MCSSCLLRGFEIDGGDELILLALEFEDGPDSCDVGGVRVILDDSLLVSVFLIILLDIDQFCFDWFYLLYGLVNDAGQSLAIRCLDLLYSSRAVEDVPVMYAWHSREHLVDQLETFLADVLQVARLEVRLVGHETC